MPARRVRAWPVTLVAHRVERHADPGGESRLAQPDPAPHPACVGPASCRVGARRRPRPARAAHLGLQSSGRYGRDPPPAPRPTSIPPRRRTSRPSAVRVTRTIVIAPHIASLGLGGRGRQHLWAAGVTDQYGVVTLLQHREVLAIACYQIEAVGMSRGGDQCVGQPLTPRLGPQRRRISPASRAISAVTGRTVNAPSAASRP